MSDWTEQEREAVDLTGSVRELFAWAMAQGPIDVDEAAAGEAFDRWLAAREAQAATKAEERVKQAIHECHDDPAKAVFDADRLAGEAIIRAHVAAAERDQLAETLRLRSEALDRAVAENARLRGVVAAVEALASDAIDAIGAAGHSHWRNGGPGGFCRCS